MAGAVRAFARRVARPLGCLAAPLLVLLAATGVALACVAAAEPTTLTTSLSGESKSGAEITVLEGTKVKDQATLEGKNAAKATGKISYAVYKDSSCKELVTKAGESEFKEGKVPASEEKTLEGGKVYYWQAHYGGDSLDAESTSTCGSEVLTVKAATSLSTSLSGEAKSGAEISILEGAKAKDKATLSGTNSSSATGTVEYKVYKDAECKELATSAGSVSVSGGSAPESEEKTLEGGKVYYWQAHYGGDSLHQASTSACGKEVLTVKAAVALSTSLSGESKSGAEITVLEGAKAKDKATLTGTGVATATGKVTYAAYKDPECKELAAEAGEVTVTAGSAPSSEEKALEAGKAYYWQASYGGDSLHQAAVGTCGEEVEKVKAATSLSTSLSGESKSGEAITILEGSGAKDKATLSGTNSSTATGKVKFAAYKDGECKELAVGAGEGSVSAGSAESEEEKPAGGAVYYWQAHYEGDALHQESTSPCTEKLSVKAATSLSTSLSGEGKSGEEITVLEGAKVKDKATLTGTAVATATGKVTYAAYKDSECKELAAGAGEVTVSGGSVPASEEESLEAGRTYYWQAEYSGDSLHQSSVGACGEEVEKVKAATSLSTSLSGESKSGSEITVLEGSGVHDKATLAGIHASTATGKVDFKVYEDSECEELATAAGEGSLSSAVAESEEVELEGGAVYYWQAHYEGDGLHEESTSPCTEKLSVKAATTLSTSLSGEGKSGEAITILEGSEAGDESTLGGPHHATATGKVDFKVYEDPECEELATGAGSGSVSGGTAESEEVELEGGEVYYWQAHYEGDALHEESTSPCTEKLSVKAKTSLDTDLSGEGKSGGTITILEGSEAGDEATLSGPHSSTATGKVAFKVYEDPECEELATAAGEGSLSSAVAESEGVELEGGAVYYWQAEYPGDSLHQPSTSACGTEKLSVKAATTLSTSLSGEGKSGEAITILEGSEAGDEATLGGPHHATATGEVDFKVYEDPGCEELATGAGDGAVSGGTADSEEVELEGGAAYYWQAHYEGDSLHQESTSPCTEKLSVKAATSLSTSLSGEGRSGEEITVLEGAKVKDKATLSGKKTGTATGKATYALYKDPKCEEPAGEAGEVTVSAGSVPASEEVEPEGGAVYYWQAEYSGDALHQASTSACGKEVLKVKAPVSVSTTLFGAETEGAEITVPTETGVSDAAFLSGPNVAGATGTIAYLVYGDPECKEPSTEAGKFSFEEGAEIPSSELQELKEGTYYWRAFYSGDDLHQEAASPCDEVASVLAATSLSTTLTGEGREGGEVEETPSSLTVAEGAAVEDTATLSGANASTATGTAAYAIYSDPECQELVTEAGEVSVEGPNVPASNPMTLEPGTYFWMVTYSGNGSNYPSAGSCGDEIEVVTPMLTTTLHSGEVAEAEVDVLEGAAVRDEATIHGEHAATATGTVSYKVYADEECKELVAEAGEVSVEGEDAPLSGEEILPQGQYFWQAEYSGDAENPPATSRCGSEITVVTTPTTLTTSLSGGEEEGEEIEVEQGTAISDQATLSGTNAASANGEIFYAVWSDSKCTELAEPVESVAVLEGEVPASEAVTLPPGTYYWTAEYTGDGVNDATTDACGDEVSKVTWPITLELSAEGEHGDEVEVVEGTPVIGEAELHGENLEEATGTVEYLIYADPECEELVTSAGVVEVKGGVVPPSNEEELESGTYYEQVSYDDGKGGPPSKSKCGDDDIYVWNLLEDKYAALGDSFAAGVGIRRDDAVPPAGATYYNHTAWPVLFPPFGWINGCHRSADAWDALVAKAIFDGGAGPSVTAESEVFKQNPPHFIFRACSGAQTINVWRAGGGPAAAKGGQFNEWLLPARRWVREHPAQALWLEEPGGDVTLRGRPDPFIKLVTLTLGINDAVFRHVVTGCIQWPWRVEPLYSPNRCIQTVENELAAGLPLIKERLPVVLDKVTEAAPRARIRLPLYPLGVDVVAAARRNIPLEHHSQLNNAIFSTLPPLPPPRVRIANTAAGAVEEFLVQLDKKVAATVTEWRARKPNKNKNVEVIDKTEESLKDHRLGNPRPWVNHLILPWLVETVHPTVCGHRAVAVDVLAKIGGGAGPKPVRC